MATQFYFKREWLDQIYALNDWQLSYYATSIHYSSKAINLDLVKIKSEFILHHCVSENLLEKVLNSLGFQLIKTKRIAYSQTKVWIRPFPYTDPRCRTKELQNKTL